MTKLPHSDEKILESWGKNAAPWSDAVREKRIESRNLVTNAAIVEAVVSRAPRTVLDIGCGEGWLARELVSRGIETTGVDAIPALIEKARSAGGAEFRVSSYEEIAAGSLELTVDVAVANFALIGKEAVDGLVSRVPHLLNERGALIIQTLHPHVANGNSVYQDGGRTGSWAGFGEEFSDPAPWYFRTLESWVRLVSEAGMRVVEMREPADPRTGRPASLILVAEKTPAGA